MHKYHYVYEVRNNINGKYYIGVHSTNDFDDQYMGSGKSIKNAILKYGKENFTKKILYKFDTREKALSKEKEIVTEKLVKDENCYNLRTGGSSGFVYSEEWINAVTDRAKKNHHLNINSEQSRLKRAETSRKRARNGEYSSPERKEKIRNTILEQREEISNRVKKDWSNKEHAEMRKKKMREAKANAPLKTCPHCGMQMKANLSRHIKARHSNFEL